MRKWFPILLFVLTLGLLAAVSVGVFDRVLVKAPPAPPPIEALTLPPPVTLEAAQSRVRSLTQENAEISTKLRAKEHEEHVATQEQQTRLVMSVAITVCVLLASLYVVLSKGFDAAAQRWAIGSIGTIVGYWLRT